MANDVFANGREISCKAADGKSICAFPDTCMTPPENPATPPGVPIPYPNTGFASDTTEGSRTVRISGKEIMLKNKSYFKTSYGDEAGCAAKKGVVTSTNRGKVYFIAWSDDVKIEGENADRHLDMTTHNHASPTPNDGAPQGYVDTPAKLAWTCEDFEEDERERCADAPPVYDADGKQDGVDCSDCPGCEEAKACILRPKNEDKTFCCHPNTTGHHLIEDQWVKMNPNFPMYRSDRYGAWQSLSKTRFPPEDGWLHVDRAPCVCGNKSRTVGTDHRDLHDLQGYVYEQYRPGGPKHGQPFTYGDGKRAGLDAHGAAFDERSGCKRDCLEAQLDEFYGPDNTRELNQPRRREGLKDAREVMRRNFERVERESAKRLTQNMEALLRKAGLIR
jgi:hypothetical protein